MPFPPFPDDRIPNFDVSVSTPRHILTVAMEDYYHVGAFNQLVQRGEWHRFESRLERATDATLALLDTHGVKATFFTLGWVADQYPELIKRVAARGHEIASKGYYHRHITQMSPVEFVDDLHRAREALERASGRQVLGYRVAGQWLRASDLWVLDLLAEEGYAYDSSVLPFGRQFDDEPWRRYAHKHRAGSSTLWEFPITTTRVLGQSVPIGGGNYLRQLPTWFVHMAARPALVEARRPFVLYFHTWELDPDQPRISAARADQRIRHYRNLAEMPARLDWFLRQGHFTSVEDYLGLEPPSVTPAPVEARPAIITTAEASTAEAETRASVTVVIPCYNEELIVPYLANTLRPVEERLGARYDIRFLFVDDGSVDGTAAALERTFGARANCRVVRLGYNSGPAGAILRGIDLAETDVVCSIDCDCSYDPHELGAMIPLLTPDVAMVTASPYHPAGGVRNVPRWRLVLSTTLSRMYRVVLRNQLATYTSCFRVYRRDAMLGMRLRRTGFLGVAEMLCQLDVRGHRIVEHPATLEVRMIGRSKLRVFRIIAGHLQQLARLAVTRRVPAPAPPSDAEGLPRG